MIITPSAIDNDPSLLPIQEWSHQYFWLVIPMSHIYKELIIIQRAHLYWLMTQWQDNSSKPLTTAFDKTMERYKVSETTTLTLQEHSDSNNKHLRTNVIIHYMIISLPNTCYGCIQVSLRLRLSKSIIIIRIMLLCYSLSQFSLSVCLKT